MRRHIIILLCLLLMVVTVSFAGYPEGYYGDKLPDGCVEVEAWITDWHDMNPWGMPDPTGAYFLFGELCVDGNVAILDFNELGWRVCEPKPWGDVTGNDEVCNAWYVGPYRGGRHVLAYDNGVYISSLWSDDDNSEPVLMFDALTFDEESLTARFVQGVFYLDGTVFLMDDDRYTRTTWTVRERQAIYMNQTRRSTRRIGE